MTRPASRFARPPSRLPARLAAALLLACAALWAHAAAAAQLERGAYYWYAPEHEKYIRTEFYREPSFSSASVRITRTQRFRFASGWRGWALLEFDGGIQAYIHLRILRSLQWDPAADDPWYEFQRASVFPEPPERIEARLKPGLPQPPQADTRAPVWKRYKESWGLDHTGAGGKEEQAAVPGKKADDRYPLLPPIIGKPAATPDEQTQSGR